MNDIFPKKEHFYKKAIDSALEKKSENFTEELKIHFVYAGVDNYFNGERLRSFILNGMKKHKIKSVMLTRIILYRHEVMTKEKMECFCKGEENEKESVNDDIESLFENIRLGKKPHKMARTYFLPKLTEKELELVDRRDTSYLETFWHSWKIDMDETEMKLSESNSRYVRGISGRKTSVIKTSSVNSAEK